MPRLTYTPRGTETSHVFDFDFEDMDSTQAMLVEKLAGCNFYTDAPRLLSAGNARIIHAFLFVLAKAGGVIPANTPPEAFHVSGSEWEPDLNTAEAQRAYDSLSTREHLSDEESEMLAELAARDDVVIDPVERDEDPKES